MIRPAANACDEALEWVAQKGGLAVAWSQLRRGDWMLWQVAACVGPPGDPSRRVLMEAVARCLALLGGDGPERAALARQWIDGTVPDDAINGDHVLSAMARAPGSDACREVAYLVRPWTQAAVALAVLDLYPEPPTDG